MHIAEKFKSYLEKAEALGACEPEFRRAKAAKNDDDILQVIKDNIAWCLEKELITADDLVDHYGSDKLKEFGIYVAGEHYISVAKDVHLVFLGSSSATIETFGSSSATIKTLGSSSVTVKTLGCSSATIETLDSSSATIKTFGSSSATIKTFGSSSATIKTFGSSSATIETLDSSSATYELMEGSGNIIKDLSKRKIFLKKSDFEIIQL